MGLIVSCFGAQKRAQLLAFQTALDGSGAMEQRILPIAVVGDAEPAQVASLQCALRRALVAEERDEWLAQREQATSQFAFAHAKAVYDGALCNIVQHGIAPLVDTLHFKAVELEFASVDARKASQAQSEGQSLLDL